MDTFCITPEDLKQETKDKLFEWLDTDEANSEIVIMLESDSDGRITAGFIC